MATTFRLGAPADLGPLDPARFLAWVIERADRTVGYLVLSYADGDAPDRRAYVSGLYLEPEERGKGIGATALRFAADVGRTLKLRIYSVGVSGEDKPLALKRA
ncbi:MAG: GNAT family N-acetyltransferase [Gemmatimonadales bacterium]